MQKIKPGIIFLRIFLLGLIILTSSLFINSCSMLQTYKTVDLNLINTIYISENDEFTLHFYESEASLMSEESDNNIDFNYRYESGIIIGSYTIEKIVDDAVVIENKELVFALVQPEILYSQNLNLLFKLKY